LIKTVASNLGYDDVAYFSRVFRKVMGSSPQEYRASR
jgi:YesN/AraC family two-component response regulator